MQTPPIMRTNLLADKSFEFAVRIVNLHKFLKKNFVEYEISKQLIRSGTAMGALIMESEYAFSKKDFSFKLTISLKEANETRYWLKLLYRTDYITKEMFDSLLFDCEELIKMLTSSIKTANAKLKEPSN